MENALLPKKATLVKTEDLSPDVKLLRVRLENGAFSKNDHGLAFNPGQFMLLGVWGYGESPFGPSSSPYEAGFVDFGVRNVGVVTKHLHELEVGDAVTLRGPFGNGYPLNLLGGKDIVMVTGGCGIPPIASLIEYLIKNRKGFGKIYLIYGAATPDNLLFRDNYARWQKAIEVILTVDKPIPGWKGCTGFVNAHLDKVTVNPSNTIVAACGPGPMAAALAKTLGEMGIPKRQFFVSEERRISCGIGRCQHCTCGDKYVCLDGPVFSYDRVEGVWD
jgi:NAD(P)H-flavin reductase